MPANLDLAMLQVSGGYTCNVGYAQFVIPGASSVDLRSSANGVAVLGESDSLSFAFLVPHNPKADKALTLFKSELDKLPKDHSMRRAFGDGEGLDLLIQLENVTPVSVLKAIFMDAQEFTLYVTRLMLKSAVPHGCAGVYTFSTQTSRGLVCVGRTEGDVHYAHVSIQNLTGTQAVGMITRLPDGKNGDIMNILPSVLKTFRFTVEGVNSEDRVREIIAEAGIAPKSED